MGTGCCWRPRGYKQLWSAHLRKYKLREGLKWFGGAKRAKNEHLVWENAAYLGKGSTGIEAGQQGDSPHALHHPMHEDKV